MKGLRIFLRLGFLLVVSVVIAVMLFQKSIQPVAASNTKDIQNFTVTRFLYTPIVHLTMHPLLEAEAQKYGYTYINRPSLIKVPNWINQPLGQY